MAIDNGLSAAQRLRLLNLSRKRLCTAALLDGKHVSTVCVEDAAVLRPFKPFPDSL